jgi:hypothetical protein
MYFATGSTVVSGNLVAGVIDIAWGTTTGSNSQVTVSSSAFWYNGTNNASQLQVGCYYDTTANVNALTGIVLLLPTSGSSVFGSGSSADVIMERL